MGDISSLKYPKKSHRKEVVLPQPSEMLAEFFGIMIGDGGINNPWQAKISLNSKSDRKYSHYILSYVIIFLESSLLYEIEKLNKIELLCYRVLRSWIFL